MKRKKRAKIMLPDIKRLITSRALNELEKNREALTDELINQIMREYPSEIPPARETVLKLISTTRNHAVFPEDEHWHLGLLEKYPLAAEAICRVLKVKEWMEKENLHALTIREAKWISRLYSFIEDNKSKWLKPLEGSIWKVAFIYASYELMCDMSKTDFDTRDMDNLLIKGIKEFTLGTVHKNSQIDTAVETTLYQVKDFGSARHYLKYLESRAKEATDARTH